MLNSQQMCTFVLNKDKKNKIVDKQRNIGNDRKWNNKDNK